MNKNENKNMNEIKDFYNNWNVHELPIYVKVLMEFEEKLIMDIINNLDDFKEIKKKKDAVILDCGCGFGSFYNLTENLNTIYLDFSFNLLKKFENTHNLKTSKICGNVLNLPFKDGSFDLILCINVLEHIKDYKKALNEIKRVLKDNGTVIIVVVNSESFINEEIFNDFKIYHRALNLNNFKNIDELNILDYRTFYFVPSFFKIFPSSILKKLLDGYYRLDFEFGKILKRKGQFLCVVMKKKRKK